MFVYNLNVCWHIDSKRMTNVSGCWKSAGALESAGLRLALCSKKFSPWRPSCTRRRVISTAVVLNRQPKFPRPRLRATVVVRKEIITHIQNTVTLANLKLIKADHWFYDSKQILIATIVQKKKVPTTILTNDQTLHFPVFFCFVNSLVGYRPLTRSCVQRYCIIFI